MALGALAAALLVFRATIFADYAVERKRQARISTQGSQFRAPFGLKIKIHEYFIEKKQCLKVMIENAK